MKKIDNLVIAVFAINATLSFLGFAASISHFGLPHVLLHPITGAVWTLLLFVQMVLANKNSPNHKLVGRVALIVLAVSIYGSMHGLAVSVENNTFPFPVSRMFVFIITAVATIVYASMAIAFAVKRNFEAHSTAILLAGAVTMTAGIARLAGGLDAVLGIPFKLTYLLCVLSMAGALWRWRPSQFYLIGSYLVLMTCVIFMR